MGRRRTLPEIARLDGNPGRRPIIDSGVQALGEPFIPVHLSDEAQVCMDLIRGSMPPRIYNALDSYALAAFAQAWAIHRRAAHEMNAPDFKAVRLNSAGNAVPSPWVKIANQQAQLLASLGDRLGLSPKARQALRLPEERPVSKFDGLLAGRANPLPPAVPAGRHRRLN